jgi:hypothetical protein
MDLEEMGWEGVNWFDLAEDREEEDDPKDTVKNLSTK